MLWRPTGILIHHSLTEDSDTLSWGPIRFNHMTKRDPPFIDIGYHAGCEKVRGQYEVLIGRPETIPGAHEVRVNQTHLGFLFVGNYDIDFAEPDMLATAARRWLAPMCLRFGIDTDRVEPHSAYSTKTCPGKAFPMDDLRAMIAASKQGQTRG